MKNRIAYSTGESPFLTLLSQKKMYTLEQLQSKTFGELKKIGCELNVFPAADRRLRQTWVDAIAGVNPPLLQLLETSPADVQAQESPIIETVEASPGVEVDAVQEPPIESKFGRTVYPRPASKAIVLAAETSPGVEVDPVQKPIKYPRAARLIAAAAEVKLIATATENSSGAKVEKSQESTIKLGDWVQVTRKPRLASGVKRGEIFQVLRVNSHDGKLAIENPHQNPKYILSARLGFLDPSEVRLVPRNRLDTPAFIDVVKRNFPDRLQELLQNPPGVEVEPTQEPIEVQAQEAISQVAKTSPGVDVDPIQGAISQVAKTSPGVGVDRVQSAIETTETQSKFDCPTCKAVGSLHIARDCCLEMWIIQCLHCDYRRPMNPSSAYLSVPDPALNLFGIFPFKDDLLRRLELQATEANEFPAPAHTRFRVGDLVKSVAQRWRISPDLTGEVVLLHPSGGLSICFGPAGGHRDYSRFESKDLIKLEPIEEVQAPEPISQVAKNSPGVEVEQAREPVIETVETSPGVEVEQVEEPLPDCVMCFGDGYIEDEFGRVKFCQCEPKLSHQNAQRAIAPATSDLNPNLTGVSLSDRFLARYSPPQSETLNYEITDGYKVDTDGQLSLFEARVVTEPEPPDPDDFESLDAFREAIARWDAENPEQLAVSIDSMCEWAPCPADWYEPKAEKAPLKASSMLEPPKVMELLPGYKSSSTSDFFIPTFCAEGERTNGRDEPPDTGGIFARLPQPKPPNFPPQAASWTQVGHKLGTTSQPKSAQVVRRASRNYPETIPKLFFRVAAGSSTQPARSPPGGDA